MPITRGARDVAADLDLRRSCRSSVEPWANSPIRCASRDPAAPPKASVIQSSASVERRVLRAYRRTVLGSRSVKMRRRQSHSPQKNFRACKEIRTGMPSQGRSPSSRTYRLCTRRDMLWHAGQTADARQARRRISMVPSLGRSKTSSTSEVSGNSVPRPIGRNGERQSYSLSTPRQRRWKESPNVRMNQQNAAIALRLRVDLHSPHKIVSRGRPLEVLQSAEDRRSNLISRAVPKGVGYGTSREARLN